LTPRAPFASPLAEELAGDVLERFLRYVRVDTQGAFRATARPSTEKQLDLSRRLVDELRELGLVDAELNTGHSVFATLPGTADAPVIGLIAHVDTTPDVNGSGVSPIVHEAWGGEAIVLPGDPRQVLDPAELPALAARVGHDVVTSDGTTLLGADDKAGIAEIMAAVAYLARTPDRPRAPIRVAFTVDEEVGRGAEDFDLEAFGAAVAYTLDGSDLGELETEAGLPPGWLNILVGPSAEIGDVIVEDERVKLITFTGSSGVGWKIRERAAKKRVNLELGNATPVVVEADADLEEAAAKLAANAFSFAGQSCISVQRIYVRREALDTFLGAFVPKVEALKVGDPADPETDVGPVIDSSNRERIASWIAEAEAQGATVLAGGEEGELLRPTVLGDVSPEMKVVCEEVFGPVCTVTPYDSLEEAFALANSTKFGLQAGIFTGSVQTVLRAARELEFGGVVVNEAPTFRADQMPYGGVKASGNTKEGPPHTVREMTEERLVVLANAV